MEHSCPNCGEVYSVQDVNDMICPKCGFRELSIAFNATLNLKVEYSSSFRSIDKILSGNKKRKRYLLDGFDRIENSQLYNRRIRRYQRIDRLSGKGIEIIRDLDTDEILYSKEYSLKDHKGHGTEKIISYKLKK